MSDAEVMRLPDGYQTNRDEFLVPKKKTKAIWQKIAEKIDLECVCAKTGEQTDTKYRSLKEGTLVQMTTIGVKLGVDLLRLVHSG